MGFVEIIDDDLLMDNSLKIMVQGLLKVAADYEKIDIKLTELSLSFVDIKTIHKINKEYRNIDRPTDVISFALNDEIDGELKIIGGDEKNYIGDILICVDIAKKQALEYNHSFEREVGFLAVHGFLHLLGYDHELPEEEKIMFGKQKEILDIFGLKR